MKRTTALLLAGVLLLAAGGCKKKAEEKPAPSPDVTATQPPPPPAADVASAPSSDATPAAVQPVSSVEVGRTYLLEKVGDFSVLRMYPDGFAKLPLQQKVLAWHLYRAAIAGDPIFYDQRYRHNRAVKGLLETILQHPQGVEPAVLEKVRTFLKLVWINHGIHDSMNGDKLKLEFTWDELLAAATAVIAGGAELLGTKDATALAAKLEELKGPLFDPAVDPYAVRRTVPEGLDLLTASSNGFYDGVTMKDLEGFTERYALNSTLAKRDGKLIELVWRAGGEGAEPGMYAPELQAVVRHLRAAIGFGTSKPQLAALEHLTKWLETGDPQEFRQYNINWVQDASPIDAILGFIEVYADPRNRKGAWEGVVFMPDLAQGEAIRKLAASAAYFEGRLPYAEQYKRTEFNPPLANMVVSLVHTGDAGPVSPAGINLPNEQAIREQYGSKSVDIANLGEAVDAITGELAIREFSYDDAERELGLRCREWMRREGIGFHEVIGHGSGKVPATLQGDPSEHLPGYYNTIEEARADLVALYLAFDPRTVEVGMLPSADCAVAVGQSYLRSGLLVLRRLPPGGIVEEDHWRATMLIVRYAMDRGAGRIEQRDGKFYFVMSDPEKWRTVIGQLLAELMRIKGEGDLAAAKQLVETYATHFEEVWRDDVLRRVEAIGYPKRYAFVSPILRPVLDPAGAIVDVTAEPAPSFEEMEWEWNRLIAEDAGQP